MAKFEIPKIKLVHVILAGIIALSAFVRLYRISELHTFHNDEGRDVMIAGEMIRSGKPTLLGPQTSVGNMYLGPLYYYLMVPALLLSGGDPVGPAVMVALSGVLTTYLIYLLGKRWFSPASALASAGIFAVSPLFVHYTASSWNPNLVPFVALLLLVTLDRQKYFLMGLGLGVLFQLHYVALAYAFVIVLAALYRARRAQIVLSLAAGFFLTSSAFWLFEVRHNFLNLQALFAYLEGSGVKNGVTAPYYQRVFTNAIALISNLILSSPLTHNRTSVPLFVFSAVTLLMSLPPFLRRPAASPARKLWYLVLSTLLLSSLLKEKLYPHYLGYLFPIVSLILGSVLTHKSRLVTAVGALYLLTWTIYSTPVTLRALGGEGSQQKLKGLEVAGYIMRDAGGKPYNVVASPSTFRETTYLYYLLRLPSPPNRTPQKLLYIICEDRPCTQQDADSPLLYARGAAHPYLDSLLTHPYTPTSDTKKTLINSTHIVYGVWVGRVIVGE